MLFKTTFTGETYLVADDAAEPLSHEESTKYFQEMEALEQKLYVQIFSFRPFTLNFLNLLADNFEKLDKEKYDDYKDDLSKLIALFSREKKPTKKTADRAIEKFCGRLVALDAPREMVRLAVKLSDEAAMLSLGFKVEGTWSASKQKEWHTNINRMSSQAHRIKNLLVARNQGLVGGIVRKYLKSTTVSVTSFDLHQEGSLGLYRAIDKFEWRRGFRFSTYANWWIRHHVSRYLSDNSRMIRLPVHIADKAKAIRTYQAAFVTEHGKYPTVREIHKGTRINIETIKVVVEGAHKIISGDETGGNHFSQFADSDGKTYWDTLSDPDTIDPIEAMRKMEIRANLVEAFKTLTEREREIITRRFGFNPETIGTDGDETLADIGRDQKLSRERVRQLQTGALRKMRFTLRNSIPTFPS